MFNKRRLLILLLATLIIMAMIVPGCKPGMEKEGKEVASDIADQLIKEGAPTMPPTPKPTPKPTPTPEEVGFRLSDETIERINNLWLPVNWSPGDFGQAYAINCSFNPVNETSMVEFEYHSNLPTDQLRVDFGQPIYQLTPPENYHSSVWIDEKNIAGDPLETVLYITETPDYNMVFISFVVYGPMLLVADLFESHWPPNLSTPNSMTYENLISSWFAYYPQTQDFELGKAWHMQPGGMLMGYEELWELYKDTPDFDDTPEEQHVGGTLTPRLSFSYDINGDGKNVIRVTARAYEQADVITMTLGTKLDF